jgi:hypothetical protein
MCRHIYKYAGLTKLVCYAGTGEAGLPDQGLVIRHTGPGYDQRLYPGYISQLEGYIPTIKERTFPAWRKIMVTECTVVVYQPPQC